jgi:hypothetical protein
MIMQDCKGTEFGAGEVLFAEVHPICRIACQKMFEREGRQIASFIFIPPFLSFSSFEIDAHNLRHTSKWIVEK